MAFLRPERGGTYIDATLGLGGHSQALLETAERSGKELIVLGIDQDEEALGLARQRLGDRIRYFHGNFADLREAAKTLAQPVAGILMDLGISSFQLDTPNRGFSFTADGPLDMRMDQSAQTTAERIVNTWSEPELTRVFFQYGEERLGRKIARFIVDRRQKQPFHSTADLAELVTRAYPPSARFRHPHPATRVFQALRLTVNGELEALTAGLEAALTLLAPGGRLAVISFHSLEDRIVKHRFRQAEQETGYTVLTKKPVTATADEIVANPRSRSAKLRVIERNQVE
ncbi:16S rRNA (cytosine(1402)-N(4))-methyltransferase RsmH, partial [Patescibacteria group bacterium]|nr:16S rRNA (cytosine(1402)-N(4))-methyltransferase RsmH [Patescibacteria group bacterium]